MPNKHIEQARSRVAPKMSGWPEQLMCTTLAVATGGLQMSTAVRNSSSLLGALLATLALAACGGHVTQSHDLLRIAASPQPIRDRAVETFLTTSTDAAEVQRMSDTIAARAGVQTWQFNPATTTHQIRSALAGWQTGIIEKLPVPPGSPRSFVVLTSDAKARDDLIAWLKTQPAIYSLIYWSGGTPTLEYGP